MVAVFPLLLAWYFNWRIIAFPIAIVWSAIKAGVRAAIESVDQDLHNRSIRLLVAAWKKGWSEPLG